MFIYLQVTVTEAEEGWIEERGSHSNNSLPKQPQQSRPGQATDKAK